MTQRALIGLAMVGLLAGFEYPQQAVSSTRVVGEVATLRSFASAASYDGGYLVAWEDGRLGPVRVVSGLAHVTAYASRISAQGAALDPAGLRVSTAPFHQDDPVPACIDVQCIVAWQQGTRGVWLRSYNAATNAWGPETTLSTLSFNYVTPRVVVDGARFLVTWGGGGTDIVGRFVGANGTPEAATLALAAAGPPDRWAVASNGSTFLVAWTGQTLPRPVRAQVFANSGAPVGGALLLAASSDSSTLCDPVAAAAGSTYFVGWCDAAGNLATRRVSDTGVATPVVQPLAQGRRITSPTVVAQGADFVVGFVDPALPVRLYAARLSGATLGVIAPDVTLLSAQPGPQLFRFSPINNEQVLATWSSSDLDSSHLYSRLVDLRDGGLTMLDAGQAIQQRPDGHLGPRVSRLGFRFRHRLELEGRRSWRAHGSSARPHRAARWRGGGARAGGDQRLWRRCVVRRHLDLGGVGE
jgi:hypothetical protein